MKQARRFAWLGMPPRRDYVAFHRGQARAHRSDTAGSGGTGRMRESRPRQWLSWLPLVWGDYWIIGLAADYSWAVVGEPSRNYLWILARAPHLDDEPAAAARAAARASGFDVERLVPTPQAGAGRR